MEIVPLLEKKSAQDELRYETKKALVRHMSSKLILLGYVTRMPHDIWREMYTKMVDVMFEGDKDFEEKFYSKPVEEAFQLYHMLKKTVGFDKPIAPLYKMNQEKRDIVLSALNPWYGDYVNPILSIKEQEQMHEFDVDVKQYFHGKNAHVMSEHSKSSCMCSSMVAVISATVSSVVVPIVFPLVCCIAGSKLACSPAVLGGVFGSAGCICLTGCCCYGVDATVLYCNSKNVTL